MSYSKAQNGNFTQLIEEGKQFLSERSSDPGKLDLALERFTEAFNLKSNSATANAALAETYTLFVGYAKMDVTQGLKLAKKYGKEAYNLDSDDLYVLKIWLRIMLYVDLSILKAKKVANEILKIAPSDVITNWKLVELAIFEGNLEEAKQTMNRLIQEMPESATSSRLAWHLYLLGDFSGSYDHAKKILLQDPQHVSGHFYLSRAAAQLGEYEVAMNSLKEVGADTLNGNIARHSEYISYVALSGDKTRASELLSNLQQSTRIHELFDYKLAQVYAALDQHEKCIKLLKKAIKKKETFVLQIHQDPMFKNIPSEKLPNLN
ncbi:MAG: tetratricopeptide repeat protein [Bdellovibrionota bacterium]